MSFDFNAPFPFKTYIPVAAAPWGRFQDGFAYEAPPTRDCPSCLEGMGAYYQEVTNLPIGAYGAFGADCGPCQIVSGGQCLPCPNGSDFPECQNCADGAPVATEASFWDRSHVLAPVIVGALTTVAATLLVAKLMR